MSRQENDSCPGGAGIGYLRACAGGKSLPGFAKGDKMDMRKVLDKVENRGIGKGIKQGLRQGIKQGVKQGVEQGIDKAQVAMALRMIQAGEPDKKIGEYTGLSESRVKAMRGQMISDSGS